MSTSLSMSQYRPIRAVYLTSSRSFQPNLRLEDFHIGLLALDIIVAHFVCCKCTRCVRGFYFHNIVLIGASTVVWRNDAI